MDVLCFPTLLQCKEAAAIAYITTPGRDVYLCVRYQVEKKPEENKRGN